MTPTLTVDTREFHAALREYLATTRRTLAEATNSRMFALLVRAYAATKPQNPQAERDRIRAYMSEPIGERRFDRKTGKKVGKARQLRRVHLIAQAKNKLAGGVGLYGDAMKKAAASLRRKAVGSVGYLKSGIAKAIVQINGHFTQFGGQKKLKKLPGEARRRSVQINANGFLVKIAKEYGQANSNVGMHRGAYSFSKAATPSFSPTASVDIAWAIQNGQEGRVSAVLNPAFQRAFDDELVELKEELARRMQADANEFTAPELRKAA